MCVARALMVGANYWNDFVSLAWLGVHDDIPGSIQKMVICELHVQIVSK